MKRKLFVLLVLVIFTVNISFGAVAFAPNSSLSSKISWRPWENNTVLGNSTAGLEGNGILSFMSFSQNRVQSSQEKATVIPSKYRYYQGQEKWNTEEYAEYNIKANGCGPTAIAVVFATITNQPITPIDIAQLDGFEGRTYTGVLMDSAVKWVQKTYPKQATEIKDWETIRIDSIDKLRRVIKNKDMPIVGHITNHFFVIDCASYDEKKDTVAVTGYKEQEGYTFKTLESIYYGKNYSSKWTKRPIDEVYIFTGNLKECNCNTMLVGFDKYVVSYKPINYLNDFMFIKDSNKAEQCEICGGKLGKNSYKTEYGQSYGMNIQNPNEEITAEEFIIMLSQLVNKQEIANVKGESYIPSSMMLRASYDSYISLTKALGISSDKNKKLGEEEIKLILGNSDSTVLKNYEEPITREKALALMGAIIKTDNDTSVNILNAGDWSSMKSEYKCRINRLVEKDIEIEAVNTNGSIKINPKDELTRAEAFILINRLYNAL